MVQKIYTKSEVSEPISSSKKKRTQKSSKIPAPQNTNKMIRLEHETDPKEMLKGLKEKHRDRPVIAHININFLDPKFEPLQEMIKNNVDILLVSETKIDDSFPEGRFFIEGYKEPIRLDRNKNGGVFCTRGSGLQRNKVTQAFENRGYLS